MVGTPNPGNFPPNPKPKIWTHYHFPRQYLFIYRKILIQRFWPRKHISSGCKSFRSAPKSLFGGRIPIRIFLRVESGSFPQLPGQVSGWLKVRVTFFSAIPPCNNDIYKWVQLLSDLISNRKMFLWLQSSRFSYSLHCQCLNFQTVQKVQKANFLSILTIYKSTRLLRHYQRKCNWPGS